MVNSEIKVGSYYKLVSKSQLSRWWVIKIIALTDRDVACNIVAASYVTNFAMVAFFSNPEEGICEWNTIDDHELTAILLEN